MQLSTRVRAFSIGICACDSSSELPGLISFLQSENFHGFELYRIIIVASGCDECTMKSVRRLVAHDRRIMLIEESHRHGKADAINKILSNSQGNYIVFVNADALPLDGSISRLLAVAERSPSIGLVSGKAIIGNGERNSTTSSIEDFMWTVHSECSSRMNLSEKNNHGCDEMMVVRSEALSESLPPSIINDGAYIGGILKRDGFAVKFCESAEVTINVPERVSDLIGQRRRIIFGHFQIWRLTGRSPWTVESLLLFSPLLALGIVVNSLAKNPKLIRISPIAVICEFVSVFLALKDNVRRNSSGKHQIWARYAK
ncbi:MAG: glycosyltransferase [Nitrososphaerota archaeon]|nr:glycosyltransferase [Nitrososphaerota archaeon]